jgi:hypothetical protein
VVNQLLPRQFVCRTVHQNKNMWMLARVLTVPGHHPYLMVSFDVVALFTKVPITDSLELLSHHFEDDVLALFKHVLTSTYFCFDGQTGCCGTKLSIYGDLAPCSFSPLIQGIAISLLSLNFLECRCNFC